VIGILLAAGRGRRFDPSGAQDKLLQRLADGEAVAVTAARRLLAVLPSVLAVVRPNAPALSDCLRAAGCDVTECAQADQGMGATLVHALRQSADAEGWVIALADMPFIAPETISALAAAIRDGADIAAPFHAGRRGNPVAFSRRHLPELLQLGGDEGARRILQRHPVREIAVDDPGIHHDVDTPGDLSR
jgi:molybdenum cofactor cytidylyltransferase